MNVSVVIPTYNRADLLPRALDSVLAQSRPVHQIIVVDDGSTDGTRDVVWQYLREHPQRTIRYLRHPGNQGQSAALNTGIDAATGDWITFLASDDTWHANKIEAQFWALERYSWRCAACFTDARFINNDHMPASTVFGLAGLKWEPPCGLVLDPVRDAVRSHLPVWVQTLLVDAGLVRKVRFDPELRFGEDADFVFRLALQTAFCFVNAPLVEIDRTLPANRPAKLWDQVDVRLGNDQRRYEKWLRLSDEQHLNGDVRAAILSHLRDTHSAWANWYLEREEYPQARKAMNQAMKYGLRSYGPWIKSILTQFAPKLARKVVLKYARQYHPEHF